MGRSLATALALWSLAGLTQAKESTPSPPHFDTTLHYALKVRNPTAVRLREVEVAVFTPAPETPWQSVRQVRSNQKYSLQTDGARNTVLKFTLDTVAPYALHLIHIEVDVRLHAAPRVGEAAAPGEYVAAEPLLEADAAEIRAAAAELKRDSPRDTARAIYEWAHGNLHYAGYTAEAKGARQALRTRSGDCTEYAYLSAALARALGIPARVVGGFVVGEQKRLRAAAYHDWAEVHVEGRWRLLDAQRGVFDPGVNAGYVLFEYVTPHAAQKAGRRFSAPEPLVVELE